MTKGVKQVGLFAGIWVAFALLAVIVLTVQAWTPRLSSGPAIGFLAVVFVAAAIGSHRLLYRVRPSKVPVFMYHSVADRFPEYPDSAIVMSISLFEWQLEYLARKGYRTLHCAEMLDHLGGKGDETGPAVMLTFDDGMLDNWVHVFPLLEKYGARATIFVATDFIEQEGDPRPTLNDVWQGREKKENLRWDGYLRRSEIEIMCRSGLVEVMPHGCSHDWAFTAPEIVGFHAPGDGQFWLWWLDNPGIKSAWLNHRQQLDENFGRPIYRYDRSLLRPAYLEDLELRRRCEDHVREHGGTAFFEQSDWEDRLLGVVRGYLTSNRSSGRLETETEYRERVLDELQRSRRLLESWGGRTADVFCWPGEAFSESGIELAFGPARFRAVTCRGAYNTRGSGSRFIERKISQECFSDIGLPWLDRLLFIANLKALGGNSYFDLLEFPLNRVKDLILYLRLKNQCRHLHEQQSLQVLDDGAAGSGA